MPCKNGMMPLLPGMIKPRFSKAKISAHFCGKQAHGTMKNVFNIIANQDPRSCTILLYGVIGDDFESGIHAADILAQIREAEAAYDRIDLRINSVGGQVDTGIAIFNALKESKADITIYIDCLAASTASFIAACGRTVKMSRYARILIHKPSGGVWGNAEEIKQYLEQLQQIEDILCDIYSRRTGLSVEQIRSTYMDGVDHWITASEAVRLGFADEVYDDLPVSFDDSLTLDQQCEQFTAQYAGKFNPNHKTQRTMFDKIKKLQPFSDCADEAAIMARLTEIIQKANAHDTVVAENTALKTKVKEFEDKEAAATAPANKALLDAAIKDGRINETQRADFEAMFGTGEAEKAKNLLASMKPARRAADVVDKPAGITSTSAWDARMEEIREHNKNR